MGAGETNITLSPPRSAAPAAAIETTTTMAVLTVRLGTQGGSRNAFAGDSSGASAASHSEENGRGPAGRPERSAMRPGIKRAPDAQLAQEKPSGWSKRRKLRGSCTLRVSPLRGVDARGSCCGPVHPTPTWHDRVAAVVIPVARCQIANHSASRSADTLEGGDDSNHGNR